MSREDPFDANTHGQAAGETPPPLPSAESAPAGNLEAGALLDGERYDRLIELWQTGEERDLATLTVRLRARPADIVFTLRRLGLLSEHVSAEQLVYARFFRGVLRTDNRRWAVDSLIRLQRLWMYFERLEDRTGLHQVMVMALTGYNRLRWLGRAEEAGLFWTFLEGKR